MSQLVFYRKYRPKSFSEVTSQKITVQILSNAIARNQIAHAYLFSGPRGTGKTTLARIFAKSINCTKRKDGEFEPCNKCESCLSMNENRDLDLIEIDAASNRGIDEIRELREGIRFAPVSSKYKVFIIDEAHQLTKEAFNALLKTLEEPPAYAVFILATTEPEKMPATILSRVQRYDFKRFSINDIVKKLEYISQKEGLKINDEALRLIALSSEGGLRDAESLLGQIAMIKEGKIDLEDVEMLIGSVNFSKVRDFIDLMINTDKSKAIEFINEIHENGYDLSEFNKGIIGYLRRLLIIKISPDLSDLLKEEITDDEAEIITKQAAKIELAVIKKWIDLFIVCQGHIKRSSIPTLPLELAVIESLS